MPSMSIYITYIYNTLPTTTINCSLARHGLHSVMEYNVANVGGEDFYPLFTIVSTIIAPKPMNKIQEWR